MGGGRRSPRPPVGYRWQAIVMTAHPRLLSTSLTSGDASNPRIVGGHGVWFELADGREAIDASNTAAPLGHCHPVGAEAVRRAAGAPVINAGWHWAEHERPAHLLVETTLPAAHLA